LRGHVRGRAKAVHRARVAVLVLELGEAEVGDLGDKGGRRKEEGGIRGVSCLLFILPPSSLILLEQDVARLEIAVDDAAGMGKADPRGESGNQVGSVGR